MDTNQLFDALTELALDLRWAWNHAADDLWRQLDPDLWGSTGNAWFVLQTVSKEKLQAAGADPRIPAHPGTAHRGKTPACPNTGLVPADSSRFAPHRHRLLQHGVHVERCVADLLRRSGQRGGGPVEIRQRSRHPRDRHRVALSAGLFPAAHRCPRQATGALSCQRSRPASHHARARAERRMAARSRSTLPGFKLCVRTWQVQVGRTKLYLLDTNDPANLPEYRGITGELYGGGPELRLQQEQVLGIGGWRLLRALGISARGLPSQRRPRGIRGAGARARLHGGPQAAVRCRSGRHARRKSLHHPHARRSRIRPVLSRSDGGAYCKQYAEDELGISVPRTPRAGPHEPERRRPSRSTWRTWRCAGSGAVNGVSRLHGEVSRRIFQELFPRWPRGRSAGRPCHQRRSRPHLGFRGSRRTLDERLRQRTAGEGDLTAIEEALRRVPEPISGRMRTERAQVAGRAMSRQRLARQLAGQGASPRRLARLERIFDPDTLTLGFARRFATYKRPESAAARSGPAGAHPHQPAASRAVDARRQGASAGPRRAGDDPAMDRVHPRPRASVARRLPQRL